MRLIDADALESALIALIFEFEHRAPKWSSNDMLTSSIDAAKKYGYKADGAEAALNVVRRMPTIDVEPAKHALKTLGLNEPPEPEEEDDELSRKDSELSPEERAKLQSELDKLLAEPVKYEL